jgi:hypothetical protein
LTYCSTRSDAVTEAEWLDCRVVQQNEFLMTKGTGRQLQLFLCACCRRVYGLLPDEQRRRVSRMASYFSPQLGVVLGDVWQVSWRTVQVAERFADGLATEDERQEAAEAAQAVSQHYGDIAACAPGPGEDPNYDDTAVKIGSDAAGAADCAASVLPSAAEGAVRVAANSVAPDDEAYYAGAHGDPDVDPDHPHLLARRAERAAQWKLLVDIFGEKPRHQEINPDWLRWQDGTIPKLARAIYEERSFDRLPVLADALEEAGCDNANILSHCRGPGPHVRGCWAVDLLSGRE